MVDSDVDLLSCATQIRDEEEKDIFKAEVNSSGSESFSSSSTKSSCNSSSSDKSDTSYIGDEDTVQNITATSSKASLFCSVPLNRISAVWGHNSSKIEVGETSGMKIKQISRKLLCLYCDRTFVSSNLRQKHVERCHSEKQSRRLSSRKLQSQFTTTACCYCDKLPVEHSLKQLFEHLISDHSEKYFGCLSCEERFLNLSLLNDHNAKVHPDLAIQKQQKTSRLVEIKTDIEKNTEPKGLSENTVEDIEESTQKLTRSMVKEKAFHSQIKPGHRQLRNKKISIKASKIGLKRSKRLQAAQAKTPVRKKRTASFESVKTDENISPKSSEKNKSSSVNPYPEFDNYYRVKKITDHSIDNLKISSLTFDDVFDKAFFSRIKCNIQENLMYHLDGKLFKNEESENRISNFEKNPPPQDVPSTSSENFGCDLTLNALTPVTSILTPHFGEDLESQIEYGSKPSKKKLQPRQDPVRHKYVTRRKYQASILEHKENRDLSKLDMWTQIIIKDRQQKVMNDQKSAKEMLEYTTCEEYKLKVQRNELNRILDRRGPFEDLKEEASKKAALDKLNSDSTNQISEECFKEVRSLMEDLLNEVIKIGTESGKDIDNMIKLEDEESFLDKVDIPEFPDYLKLRRISVVPNEEVIDKSDKIALICSSQETENYELPTNTIRAKNEMVELSGEWARSRIYVCAACGLKLSNMKLLLEHKSLYHQNAWVQHYEFVGNQSKLYRHLCIPGLGKVGHVEDTVQCKLWRRSEARMCTKCGKVCNALAELHRHILECGGDWTWMLARKKCKYRPFGSRKKRRGLVKRIRERINNQKTEQTEKKKYKKRFEGPRQRPSDADTIQRMLANLPPKRSSRKSICMKDGFPRNLNKKQNKNKQVMKCGKIVMKKPTYTSTDSKVDKSGTNHKNVSVNRTLRSLNRTLSSKILDTSNKLRVKRQLMKNLNRRTTRRSTIQVSASCDDKKMIEEEHFKESNTSNVKRIAKSANRVKNTLQEKINMKSFFPVSKRKLTRNNHVKNAGQPQYSDNINEKNISERKKSRSSIKKLIKKTFNCRKKIAQESEDNEKFKGVSEPIVVIEKLQQSEQNIINPVPSSAKSPSNKRKLRSSFRKVIDKVKKLKLDNSSSSLSSEKNKISTIKPLNSFLGQGTKEKEKLPTILVPLVEEPKENPPSTPAFVQNVINSNSPTEESLIPENIFNLEHNSENLLQAKSPLEDPLNELRIKEAKNAFETFANMKECKIETDAKQEISVDTKAVTVVEEATNSTPNVSPFESSSKEMSFLSIETGVKSDRSPLLSPVLSPSALSPKIKGKLRKPNRGLNDCIAMLTKKASEVKTCKVDTSDESFIQPQEKKPIVDNKNVAHKFVRPNECILKIPVFETESNKNFQNEVLDLSKPKKKIEDEIGSFKEDSISTLKMPFLEPSVKRNNFVQNSNKSISSANLDDFWKPLYNAMQKVIPNSISEKAILKIPKIVETTWTTVDDIIQRVVENRCESNISRGTLGKEKSQLKIPSVGVSNSVDEIIEEVVKGDMAYSYKDFSMNNKGLDALVENVLKERKILNNTSKRKSRKLTKKDTMPSINIDDKRSSITPAKIFENLADNGNPSPDIKRPEPQEADLSTSTKLTVTPNSKSANLHEEPISIHSNVISKEKEEVPVSEGIKTLIDSRITDISSRLTATSVDSRNSESQDLNTEFTEVVPEMTLNEEDNKSSDLVGKSPMNSEESNILEANVRKDCKLESNFDLDTENLEIVQKNMIQKMQTDNVKISPKENEDISELSTSRDICSARSSVQISECQAAEIPLAMNVNVKSEGNNIKETKIENIFLNRTLSVNIHENNRFENTERNDSYSTPENEPIILEEKTVCVDSKKSASTDSEDELPLVILKAKSKIVPSTSLISASNDDVHKSSEEESISCVTTKIDRNSDVSVENTLNAVLNNRENGVSNYTKAICVRSPINKLITAEFPLLTVKESTVDQIKYKEVSEHFSDFTCGDKNVAPTKSRQKCARRRSARKTTTSDESAETSTNELKKTKSSKCDKSNHSNKTKLGKDIDEDKAGVNYNEKSIVKVSKGIDKDKVLVCSVEDVICDEGITTECSFMKNAISEEELTSNDGQADDSKKGEPADLEIEHKNNETFNLCSIPILKIAKTKSDSKGKVKNKANKAKLILKLPKIVLKEPTLKLPFSESVLQNELMDNQDEINEDVKSPHIKRNQSSPIEVFQEINESAINSQELIEKPVRTGITLRLRTKLKKRNNKYKKKSFSFTQNKRERKNTPTFPSELSEASVVLPDILKVMHNESSISGDLPIPVRNIVSKDVLEFVSDKTELNEFVSSRQSTITHDSIISVSKLNSNRHKQKRFGDKKKKAAKKKFESVPLFTVPSERNDEGSFDYDCVEPYKIIDSSKIDKISLDESSHCHNLKEINNKCKNKVKRKPNKSQMKSNECSLLGSSDLSESDINLSRSNLETASVNKINQFIMPLAGDTKTYGTTVTSVFSQESQTAVETIESDLKHNINESNANVLLKNSKNFNTTNNTIQFDCKENDNFNSITELTSLGYSSLEHIDTKEPKKSINQYKADEKKEPSNSKPVRSLRSTVKITYKQSNIFALQMENREISDLKITEKSNNSSTENNQGTSELSEIKNSYDKTDSIKRIFYDETVQEHREIGNEKNKKSNLKKNANIELSHDCPSLLVDSKFDEQVFISLNNPQNDETVILKEEQPLLEIDTERQQNHERSKNSEVGDQVKIIISKEVEKADKIINTSNIYELNSESLVQGRNSETLGDNNINLNQITSVENTLTDTEIISPRIGDNVNVSNVPSSEDAIVSFSEKVKDLNVSELRPLILENKNNVNHLDLTPKVVFAKKPSNNVKEIDKKSTKIKNKKDETIELDDLSLAELKTLSFERFNDKIDPKISTKKIFSTSHKKNKPKKIKNMRNIPSLTVSNDNLCHSELNASINEKDNKLMGITSQLVLDATDILSIDENSLSNKGQYKPKTKMKKKEEDAEFKILVNNENSSNRIEENKDTGFIIEDITMSSSKRVSDSRTQIEDLMRKYDIETCALDTKKNGSSDRYISKQISDEFEFNDDLITTEELSSKFRKDKDTNIPDAGFKSNLSWSLLPEHEIIDELKGEASDMSSPNVQELPVESKLRDVTPKRRSRTAKVKALENINTLERNFGKEVELYVPQETEYYENEMMLKKKKSPKISGNGKHVKNNEAINMAQVNTSRRSRTAKAKALENICSFEKIANNNPDEDEQENLNNDSIFLQSEGNAVELLSSSQAEEKVTNSLRHHDEFNKFESTSFQHERNNQNVDNLNEKNNEYFPTAIEGNVNMSATNQTIRTKGIESFIGETSPTQMNIEASLIESDKLIILDEKILKVKSDSAENDEPCIVSESFTKNDSSFPNVMKRNAPNDEDANLVNNVSLSETNKTENLTISVEHIAPIRKSRLAKSKAIENINDLKKKTDNIDFEANIIENKNNYDKTERNSKKHKQNRKSDNFKLSDENISKEFSEKSHEIYIRPENLENIFTSCEQEITPELLDKSEKVTDCYDISKIDEDDNLKQNEPIIFSTMKNKTNKSKVLRTKRKVHSNDVPTTEEVELNTNETEKSEPKLMEIEQSIVSSSQIVNCKYELADSFEISSVLETTAHEILKDEQIEKRDKKKFNKKKCIEKQKHKKPNTTQESDDLKLSEYLIDTEGILLNKSSGRKSEMEKSSTENDILSNNEHNEHFEEPLPGTKIDEDSHEDEIIKNEAVTKLYGGELNESENKRSRRACKVNTYNENDLAEAIFMQASVQKEKEKSKKKRLDSNIQHCSSSIKKNENKNSRTLEKAKNSDELFDMLKATSTENLSKPSEQIFSGAMNDIQTNLTDDNFDIVFDDILKKSQVLFGEKSRNEILNKSADSCTSNYTSDNIQSFKDDTKLKNSRRKSLESYFTEETKISGQSLNQNDISKSEDAEELFCEICKKSFKRIDNLIKHRTTLTHISKLSEIEAKEAEDKAKHIEQVSENTSKSNQLVSEAEITKPSELESLYCYSPPAENDALKIAEIITNSFEKPGLGSDKSFSKMVPPVSEYRRYKSLGERKSFESDQGSSNISDNINITNPYESHIPNNAGVILEKQITLLQNIIENRGLDYIDDMSISSYPSLENSNIRVSPVSVMSSKGEVSRNFIFPRNAGCLSSKKTEVESFLKPPQVEDISEDSVNLKNSEDVKSRKVLNRDEELFLECCSLLKSGSEVSNFSKKSNRTVLNNKALITSDEPDIFESKVLIDKMTEESSDYSRIATPLGDSFGDTSNSNTVLSNWTLNKDENIVGKEKNYFNFKENNLNSNEESFYSSQFRKLVSNNSIESPLKDASKMVQIRKQTHPLRVQGVEEVEHDSSSKMPTKGALKVFEGLKVSISTVELNLEEVLNNSPPIKKMDTNIPDEDILEKQFSSPKTPRSSRKSKPVKNKQQLDDRFIFKVNKKSTNKECETAKLDPTKEASNKIQDVYDFEETQDNTDVFVKPDFKTFRIKGLDEPRNENIFENNYEGHTLSSSSSSTNSLCKKSKTNECITKKKHMIMGRIFKNALKPKADEDIRDIPNIDHNELVENYVLSCTPKIDEEFKKPKMTEDEMNYLFDKLLDKPIDTSKKQNVPNKIDLKTTGLKKKLKIKCKKRQRSNSDSTDDEFGLSRIVKKRPSRKNAKVEDNSINLEQELKECIGVASRKSQRKCTSGKQNVLVEYWSSDESAFEAFLESHLQELSTRTDLPEQPNESLDQNEPKIEEENPVGKTTTGKLHNNDKEPKIKSKKCIASKKKGSYIQSATSAGVSQSLVQVNRRKRAAANPLYHWSSSSEDEMQDLIEVKSIRDDNDDEYDEDRPIQHGWIVGDSPKKLVTMLAQAKGKKIESESSVKEQGKKKNSNS